ncbi:MAG: hypothetical protein ACKN9J_04525 [Holophagaceae bacterium]
MTDAQLGLSIRLHSKALISKSFSLDDVAYKLGRPRDPEALKKDFESIKFDFIQTQDGKWKSVFAEEARIQFEKRQNAGRIGGNASKEKKQRSSEQTHTDTESYKETTNNLIREISIKEEIDQTIQEPSEAEEILDTVAQNWFTNSLINQIGPKANNLMRIEGLLKKGYTAPQILKASMDFINQAQEPVFLTSWLDIHKPEGIKKWL